jgi:hypothetical protein
MAEGSPRPRSANASPNSTNASPRSTNASPKAANASPKAANAPTLEEMDMSLMAWLTNSHAVLHWPSTIISVIGLIVAGSFAQIAPRESMEFLDNTFGSIVFFIIPFIFAAVIDWPTGLLAAVVSLIFFARLQKEDSSEGFSDIVESDQSTKLISNPHRWFIEKVLGERPIAISSDRIGTSSSSEEENIRTSSSSTSSTQAHTSSSSSNK